MRLLLLSLFLSSFYFSQDKKQEIPRFKKHHIGTSEFLAYFPSENPVFNESISEDGSTVTTCEVASGDYSFSLIHIDFKDKISDKSDQISVITSYLEFLQQQFEIQESAGLGKGHELKEMPTMQGVIDYWADSEGTQFAIKAWIDEVSATVFILYGPDSYPYLTAQEMFFNGLRKKD